MMTAVGLLRLINVTSAAISTGSTPQYNKNYESFLLIGFSVKFDDLPGAMMVDLKHSGDKVRCPQEQTDGGELPRSKCYPINFHQALVDRQVLRLNGAATG